MAAWQPRSSPPSSWWFYGRRGIICNTNNLVPFVQAIQDFEGSEDATWIHFPEALRFTGRWPERLDALPNGFPPHRMAPSCACWRCLFTPEEAHLAAGLRLTLETPEQIAARLDLHAAELKDRLRLMARKGLITAGRIEGGLGFGLMPFVVGIYEAQAGRIDAELARLFEDYYQRAFRQTAGHPAAVHRVVPVNENVRLGMEIRALRKRQPDRADCPGLGCIGLHLPHAESAHRAGLLAPGGCVYGAGSHGRVCSTRIR